MFGFVLQPNLRWIAVDSHLQENDAGILLSCQSLGMRRSHNMNVLNADDSCDIQIKFLASVIDTSWHRVRLVQAVLHGSQPRLNVLV